MHATWRQRLGLWMMVVALLIPVNASAQLFFPLRPPLEVRMSGVLQPFEEKGSHDLNTLTVTIDNQKRLFKVGQVEAITSSDPGLMLLSHLFPPELRLIGAPTLLASLEQSQVNGKTVALQGFLYIQDRNFYVGEVSVGKAVPQ